MKFRTTIIAIVASLLVVASAGAATRYLITSTHQIKPSVLAQLHGARGAKGDTGAPGVSGLVTVHRFTTAAPRDVTDVVATCPTGTALLGIIGYSPNINESWSFIPKTDGNGRSISEDGLVFNPTDQPAPVFLDITCARST